MLFREGTRFGSNEAAHLKPVETNEGIVGTQIIVMSSFLVTLCDAAGYEPVIRSSGHERRFRPIMMQQLVK